MTRYRPSYRVTFAHDPEPDFSWLAQDIYDPASRAYRGPVYPSRRDMGRQQHAYDPQWYRNPEHHVALTMLIERETEKTDAGGTEWEVIDALGNIDFLADSSDWGTGTFYQYRHIPAQWKYLRSLVRDSIGRQVYRRW